MLSMGKAPGEQKDDSSEARSCPCGRVTLYLVMVAAGCSGKGVPRDCGTSKGLKPRGPAWEGKEAYGYLGLGILGSSHLGAGSSMGKAKAKVFMGRIRATPALSCSLMVFYDALLWAPNEGHSRFMAPVAITLPLIAAQLVSGLPGTQQRAAPSPGQGHPPGWMSLPWSSRHLRRWGASCSRVPRREKKGTGNFAAFCAPSRDVLLPVWESTM